MQKPYQLAELLLEHPLQDPPAVEAVILEAMPVS